MPQLDFLSQIDDHGGRWDNMVQILAQWRRPVASSAAMDCLHWAMCSVLHHSTHMVIEMARKVHVYEFFDIVNFNMVHTVAKRPCFGH
jgi:hypothetical protein